jgi:hypothetical protein
MPTRKRLIRDEAIPQIRAQKLDHAKHSEHFSKKRNERFSLQGSQAPRPKKPNVVKPA